MDADSASPSEAQAPGTDDGLNKLTNLPSQSADIPSALLHDPCLDLPVISFGMTGIIYALGDDRVVKKAKRYGLEHCRSRADAEYLSEINQHSLKNEVEVFKRLGSHRGIIPCFRTSQYGIELARAQGDLEYYLETNAEPDPSFKVDWILSLIDTFAYVHSRRVFVDDIALRNILILDGQPRLADFGQSVLLPLDTDMTSTIENDLNAKIEILHLGWLLYSIATWQIHKYYFFNPENPDLCWPDSFPEVGGVLCGKLIEKCWQGEYASMSQLKEEAEQLFGSR